MKDEKRRGEPTSVGFFGIIKRSCESSLRGSPTVPIILLALLPLVVHAQPDTLWLKTYGDGGGECLYDAIQSNSGGYLLFGYRVYYDNYTYYVTRVDTGYGEMWSREVADSGHLYGLGVCETPSGDILVAGDGHYSGNVTYGLAVEISAEGDSLWANYYGGRSANLFCVTTTKQGTIVVGGQTAELSENGGFDAYLVWIDEEGEILDERAYGGRSNDMFMDIATTADGGLVAAGNTGSLGAQSFYLVKVDSNGDEEWSQSYGGDSTRWCTTVIQNADGGYALAGKRYDNDGYMSWDEDMFIVRTDANGELLWQRAYGGDHGDMCWSIVQTKDGGFLLGGETGSFGADLVDVYLVRIDSLGDEQWSALYNSMRSGWDDCRRIFIMDDGGYLLAGQAYGLHELPDGNGQLYPGEDFALWRTEPDPLFNAAPREATPPLDFQLLAAYPNPFNTTASIRYQIPVSAPVSVRIFDLSGREVITLFNGQASPGEHQLLWNASGFQAGTYIARLEAGDFRQAKKMILVK